MSSLPRQSPLSIISTRRRGSIGKSTDDDDDDERLPMGPTTTSTMRRSITEDDGSALEVANNYHQSYSTNNNISITPPTSSPNTYTGMNNEDGSTVIKSSPRRGSPPTHLETTNNGTNTSAALKTFNMPRQLPTGNIGYAGGNSTSQIQSFTSHVTSPPTNSSSTYIPHSQQLFISSNEKIEKLMKDTFGSQLSGLSKTISFLQNVCNIEENYQQKIANECSNNFDSYFQGELGKMLNSCRSFYYKNSKSSDRFTRDVKNFLCEPLQQIYKDLNKKKKLFNQTHDNICKTHNNALNDLQHKRKNNDQKRQNLENAERKWKLALSQSQSEKSNKHESMAASILSTFTSLSNEQTKSKYEQNLEEYSESEIELQQSKKKYDLLVHNSLQPQFKAMSDKLCEQYTENGTIIHLYMQHLTKLLEARVIEAQNNLDTFKKCVDSMKLNDIQTYLTSFKIDVEEPKRHKEDHSHSFEKSNSSSSIGSTSNTTPFISVYSQERDDDTVYFENVLNEIWKKDESTELSTQESLLNAEPPQNSEGTSSNDSENIIVRPIVDSKYMSMLTETKNRLSQSQKCRLGFCKVLNQKRSKACFTKFDYFQDLAELMGYCLDLAHSQSDQNVGRLILNMTQTFYYYGNDYPDLPENSTLPKEKKKIFVYSILDDMDCWQDLRFWEYCLYDALNSEKLNRQTSNQVDSQQWQAEHENVVFGILSSFCFTMNEMKISPRIIRQFADKMCNINSLNDDYRQMVLSVVDNNSSLNDHGHETEKMSKYRSKRLGMVMEHDSNELDLLRIKIQLESTKIEKEYFSPTPETNSKDEAIDTIHRREYASPHDEHNSPPCDKLEDDHNESTPVQEGENKGVSE
ncbi:hypothetical protein C9374_009947 [Naegleria lovaniensis]|uniref:SBF1/SBF2 domain-containing protein n=1 Tax=Naegleria lovaniensis TaxID=51637 RepID=A0AA88GHF4_NAELO|nr:uncharacterized protein C9374_009947 [Naegleria lovaniensis]KAG2375324.1 hypothetical protein C9374_009947 [Naegleria lovaniensis]